MNINDSGSCRMSCQKTPFDIYAVLNDYAPSDDVLSDDDILVQRVKKIVYTRLNETDRRILLAYAELGSLRQTAKLFKVSTSTIWLRIQEIRKKIKEYLK